MQEETKPVINTPEGELIKEENTIKEELSQEQKRKLALEAEIEMRKVLHSTKSVPYKKEFKPKLDKEGKEIPGEFEIANPITQKDSFNNLGLQTRAQRRGGEKVDFSLFGNSIQTHKSRKTRNGRWVSK